MDIDAIADRLYALDPDEFTAARDAVAREQRDAGAKQAVKGLRRPVAAAHAVNLLARERRAELDELIDLGDALRRAMHSDPSETRRLTERRRELIAALVDRKLPASVQQDVTATLEAATADPQLAEVARSGRLVKPLRYAGFGSMPDLDDVMAVRVRSRRTKKTPPPKPAKKQPRRDEPDLARLRAEVLELAGAADDAQRRYDEAVRAAQQARAALDVAEQERAEAHRAAREAHQAAEKSRRELGRLERS